MSVEVERATVTCQVCGAHVTELRRGRCWGCYTRWVEARPVGRGAACVICFEKRREQLKMMELHTRSLPICHGCAARILRLDQIPATIDGVRQALKRDRRDGDRRDDGLDRRIFPRERRVGERRGPAREPPGTPPDPGAAAGTFLAPDDLDVIIELVDDDLEFIEQTTVNARSQPDE
ncbi:MAG TPA: hypothetical protein VFH68_23965 [Polyangia bacterium]|jgi:hypothetical protein|nr:hypothetical protein [Polyangia bacterium]